MGLIVNGNAVAGNFVWLSIQEPKHQNAKALYLVFLRPGSGRCTARGKEETKNREENE